MACRCSISGTTRPRGAGRILSDLGAAVVRVVPPSGDPLTGNVARAWNAGKAVQALAADDPALADLLAGADIVFDTPGFPGVHHLDPEPGTGRGVGAHHAVRQRGTARGLARHRPRRDGRVVEHVQHGRSRPRAGAVERTDGVRAHAARKPRSRR